MCICIYTHNNSNNTTNNNATTTTTTTTTNHNNNTNNHELSPPLGVMPARNAVQLHCLGPHKPYVLDVRGSQGRGFEHRSTRGFEHVKN